jgi:hypothetical protein
MERPIEIVRRYEEGDSDERLCLFLQFRELRDVFDDIDLKDPVIKITTLSPVVRIVSDFIKALWHWLLPVRHE